jgi:rod shape-determining protein MreD
MTKIVKFFLIIVAALVLQVALFPVHLADPFKPNLLIVIVVYLGLRGEGWSGGCLAFLLGLFLDCFSGIYLGLNGFSFLFIYLLLKTMADRLYAESIHLMILAVFFATLGNGLLHLLLLMVFSAAKGVYASLLPGLLPQGLVNALAASVVFGFSSFGAPEEGK